MQIRKKLTTRSKNEKNQESGEISWQEISKWSIFGESHNNPTLVVMLGEEIGLYCWLDNGTMWRFEHMISDLSVTGWLPQKF